MTAGPSAIDLASFLITLVSFVVAAIALLVALAALRRSDRNASGATMIALYESFRQGWDGFQDERDPAKSQYHLADLMNLFEIACAIHQDGSIHGHPRKILEEYLCDTIGKFCEDAAASSMIRDMIEGGSTFEFIACFQAEMHPKGKMSPKTLVTLSHLAEPRRKPDGHFRHWLKSLDLN